MSDEKLLYSCTRSEHGKFSLLVSVGDEPKRATGALLDILLLHKLEKLTQTLEDIIQQPLDWQRESGFNDLQTNDLLELAFEFEPQECIAHVTLLLPLSILSLMAVVQISQPEGSIRMSWKPLSCALCLSELNLSVDEQNELQQGALVILPESFQSVWNSKLEIGRELLLQGQFNLNDDVWLSESAMALKACSENPGAGDNDNKTTPKVHSKLAACTHRVLFMCQLDPADLICASSKPVPIGLSGKTHEASLFLIDNERSRYQGSLISLGTGQAILLERVEILAATK